MEDCDDRNGILTSNKEDEIGKAINASESHRFNVEREGLRSLGDVVQLGVDPLAEVIGQRGRDRFVVINRRREVVGDLWRENETMSHDVNPLGPKLLRG